MSDLTAIVTIRVEISAEDRKLLNFLMELRKHPDQLPFEMPQQEAIRLMQGYRPNYTATIETKS